MKLRLLLLGGALARERELLELPLLAAPTLDEHRRRLLQLVDAPIVRDRLVGEHRLLKRDERLEPTVRRADERREVVGAAVEHVEPAAWSGPAIRDASSAAACAAASAACRSRKSRSPLCSSRPVSAARARAARGRRSASRDVGARARRRRPRTPGRRAAATTRPRAAPRWCRAARAPAAPPRPGRWRRSRRRARPATRAGSAARARASAGGPPPAAAAGRHHLVDELQLGRTRRCRRLPWRAPGRPRGRRRRKPLAAPRRWVNLAVVESSERHSFAAGAQFLPGASRCA